MLSRMGRIEGILDGKIVMDDYVYMVESEREFAF